MKRWRCIGGRWGGGDWQPYLGLIDKQNYGVELKIIPVTLLHYPRWPHVWRVRRGGRGRESSSGYLWVPVLRSSLASAGGCHYLLSTLGPLCGHALLIEELLSLCFCVFASVGPPGPPWLAPPPRRARLGPLFGSCLGCSTLGLGPPCLPWNGRWGPLSPWPPMEGQ